MTEEDSWIMESQFAASVQRHEANQEIFRYLT